MNKRNMISAHISVVQARAIGRLTVNFNWMEHAVEVLIEMILGSPGPDLAVPLVSRMRFGTKLDVLKELVDALALYVPSKEQQKVYEGFASEVRGLVSRARQLNTFRNSIVHWRPFLRDSMPKVRIDRTAKAIEAKAADMEAVGTAIFRLAIGVRQGDNALTFGRQFRT